VRLRSLMFMVVGVGGGGLCLWSIGGVVCLEGWLIKSSPAIFFCEDTGSENGGKSGMKNLDENGGKSVSLILLVDMNDDVLSDERRMKQDERDA
jgi:hypothetical protein